MSAAATVFFRSPFRTKRFREAVASCPGWDPPISLTGDVYIRCSDWCAQVRDRWILLAADRVERRDMRRTAGR